MKNYLVVISLLIACCAKTQLKVDFSSFNKNGEVKAEVQNNLLKISWPAGKREYGKLVIDLQRDRPLFKSIQLGSKDNLSEIAAELDPVFLLTIGKRDLISQNGWNIFFDKTNKLPYQSYPVTLQKRSVRVSGSGNRTAINIGDITAGSFNGALEITLYNGSPLLNIAAVMSTEQDSTAILFDAGLVAKDDVWRSIAWTDVEDRVQSVAASTTDSSRNMAVKYRAISATAMAGSMVVFPPPHQYFYPLDEAFNLKFTWYGKGYHKMVGGYGIGIRQDAMGDNRWVPWFNAPPGTKQRLNFFCLLSREESSRAMEAVKQFTHHDSYQPLKGYKTMSSHFHNEYVMTKLLPKKAEPGIPAFVGVFKKAGIDIVHLAEFHYTAHPKGPAEQRLAELKALFGMCRAFSDENFVLLPGEEPNEFFGGHWLSFFPKPVYWIMSRKADEPFLSNDTAYGKVYRIGDEQEMLRLLEAENGLAWTAHARTKGSTGYPDNYKQAPFFTSKHFFGAAWKAMPADLSEPRLGLRVLDLMDDMANWGLKKHVIAEADLFSIEPENEMYAHLNVNYLQLDSLPVFEQGWQNILDVMQKGKFFVSTGEVLIPSFTVNGKTAGESIRAPEKDSAVISIEASWTFPLNFAEIIMGDGAKVYRKRINLDQTLAFGNKKFLFTTGIKNMKWLRVEIWDVAVNGAFTQPVWIE